jgi:hypothetical protein
LEIPVLKSRNSIRTAEARNNIITTTPINENTFTRHTHRKNCAGTLLQVHQIKNVTPKHGAMKISRIKVLRYWRWQEYVYSITENKTILAYFNALQWPSPGTMKLKPRKIRHDYQGGIRQAPFWMSVGINTLGTAHWLNNGYQ